MIFVHIGLNKVASSTIQLFLTNNKKLLADNDIVYPTEGISHQTDWLHTHNALGLEISEGSIGKHWQCVRTTIDHLCSDQHAVLSSEVFGIRSPELLREALGGHSVRLIVYIRDQGRLITSRYVHNTKSGLNRRPFDLFFRGKIRQSAYRFYEYLEPWRRVFGGENIEVGVLDKRMLRGGDVRLDFLRAIGVDASAQQIDLGGSINSSPGWKLAETLRHLNTFTPEEFAPRRTAFSQLAWNGGFIVAKLGLDQPGQYLDASQISECAELFSNDIAKLRASDVRTSFEAHDALPIEPRSFLPSFAEIPADDAERLISALSADPSWRAAME